MVSILFQLFARGLLKWLSNCPLLVELVDKTALPNSTISLTQVFYFFINFICEIKNIYEFEHVFEYLSD